MIEDLPAHQERSPHLRNTNDLASRPLCTQAETLSNKREYVGVQAWWVVCGAVSSHLSHTTRGKCPPRGPALQGPPWRVPPVSLAEPQPPVLHTLLGNSVHPRHWNASSRK
jgi:hypothetical protein